LLKKTTKKRKYTTQHARRVSGITFTRYAQSQKVGKRNYWKLLEYK